MVRILVGLFFLAIAAPLLVYAGGIDVRSPAEWRNIPQAWTLPSKDDNERSIVLLLGVFAMLLAFVRLITPRNSRSVAKQA